MSRDVVLATTALVLCGATAWLAGWLATSRGGEVAVEALSGRRLERRAWRRLWLPLLPAAVALATLLGWALQEPSVTDEPLHPLVWLFTAPLFIVWVRAAARAGAALRRPRVLPPVATLGLLRPRVIVAAEVSAALDPEAMAAALAHERAHVRHLDPLRIWAAQIATDLQWPVPGARGRLARWLEALELARDEEARLDGAAGEALASAVVAVARLSRGGSGFALASLTGAEASLAARIHRLLDPLRPGGEARSIVMPLVVIAALSVGLVVGLGHGDSLMRALPFIAA